jgi:prepilin-type N-terminal cleavage/methylation domain-containing protein/prepilin-type processing-associated H-X9-DG protein
MTRKCHPRSAFTLIELLAVIVILGLLMALLLPAMGRMRESAATVKCAGNLRQIGGMFMAYVADNDGYMPAYDQNNPSAMPAWYEAFWKGGYTKTEWGFDPVFYCPITGKNGKPSAGGAYDYNNVNPDYGMNYNLVNSSSPGGGILPRKFFSIPKPSLTVLMADSGSSNNPLSKFAGDFRLLPNYWWNNFIASGPKPNISDYSPAYAFPCFRHPRPSGDKGNMAGGACNMLFFDGHVEAISYNDQRIQTLEGRRQLFSGDPSQDAPSP